MKFSKILNNHRFAFDYRLARLYIKVIPAIVLLLWANPSLSQDNQRNYFPVQDYVSFGINGFNGFDYQRFFQGDSPQSVCAQIDGELRRYYDFLEELSDDGIGGGSFFELMPSEAIFEESLEGWRCYYTYQLTFVDPPWPDSVSDGGGAVNVNNYCQTYEVSQNQVGWPSHISFHDAVPRKEEGRRCYCNAPYMFDEAIQWCNGRKKNDGCTPSDEAGSDTVGNPCHVATGNKVQSETDFSNNGLSFTRTYNSQAITNLGFGQGWTNNYLRRLSVGPDTLIQISGTGRGERWFKNSNNLWYGWNDTDVSIIETDTGFQLTKANGGVEQYSPTGQLLSQTETNGLHKAYNYNSDNQLTQVIDQYGQGVGFEYEGGLLTKATDTFGSNYYYEYDEHQNLVAVIYPDLTPDDNADNPRKVYHYENPDFPKHLTGITDENGDRYASWSYDAQGRANSSEHAQTTNQSGQERVDLDFQGAQ